MLNENYNEFFIEFSFLFFITRYCIIEIALTVQTIFGKNIINYSKLNQKCIIMFRLYMSLRINIFFFW